FVRGAGDRPWCDHLRARLRYSLQPSAVHRTRTSRRQRTRGDFVGDRWGETHGALDCNGHGTHVAAVAAGAESGVAREARVRALRVTGCDGSGTVNAALDAIDWVTANAEKPAVVLISADYND
ncbi:MAG: S8 family serine peptidase, partial [Dehalococcoidia bacterium]